MRFLVLQKLLRPIRDLATLVTMVSGIWGSWPARALSEGPDPIALLRGVESARLSIGSGKIDFAVKKTFKNLPGEGLEQVSVSVVFEKEKRKYEQRQRALMIEGSDAKAKEKILKAMNEDKEAFVRAGHGKWEEVHVRSIFDGEKFIQYSEKMGASIRPHRGGTPEMVFDPRTLGITVWYDVNDTIESCLRYRGAKSVSLVREEQINAKPAWHVLVRNEFGQDWEERHFWIEDKEGYRVYKHQLRTETQNLIATSEYDEENAKRLLPVRVLNRRFNRKGEISAESLFVQTKSEFGIPVEAKTFGLAGLGLPIGESVSDERIGQRLGYWNGEGLTQDFREAVQIGQTAAKQRKWMPWIAGILLIGIVFCLMVYGYRRYMKVSPNNL